MFRRLLSAITICCLLPVGLHAKDLFDLIPDNHLGYVVVNRLAATDEKIQDWGELMKLPIPSLLSMLKTHAGIVEGIDESGSVGLVFLPAMAAPTAVLFVPVDDYDAFVEQLEPDDEEANIISGYLLGRPVVVGEKSGYAVVARQEDRDVLQGALSGPSARKNGSETLKTWEGCDDDVAAVLSADGVELFAALGQQGLQIVMAIYAEESPDDDLVPAIFQLYADLLASISAEVTTAAASLQLDKTGSLVVNEWVWLQPDGKAAAVLKDLEPHRVDLLSGLPDIPYVIATGGVMPKGSMSAMMEFSRSIMKTVPQMYGLTPEQIDLMIDLSVKYFTDISGMSLVMGAGQADVPLYSEMLAAMHVDDAKSFIDNYRNYWAEMDEVLGDAKGSMFHDVEVEDVQIDGTPALKIKMPIPSAMMGMPNQEEVEKLMEQMYGPGGITMFFAAADDHTALMSYTSPTFLSRAMGMTRDNAQPISAEPNLVETSKHLPTDAILVGYLSLSGTVAFANRAAQMMQPPDQRVTFPAFPEAPPVGGAITVTAELVQCRTVLPAKTSAALGDFIREAKRMGVPANADSQ